MTAAERLGITREGFHELYVKAKGFDVVTNNAPMHKQNETNLDFIEQGMKMLIEENRETCQFLLRLI